MRAMMPLSETERRHASDRRRFARGGRRPGDKVGLAPLVLVASEHADGECTAPCAEILSALRFAVAPANSVEETLRVLRVLRPDLVVSELKENARLREELRTDPYGADLPFIALDDGHLEPGGLIEEIRRLLRAKGTLAFPTSTEPPTAHYHSGSR
jgi:hypothetical protein